MYYYAISPYVIGDPDLHSSQIGLWFGLKLVLVGSALGIGFGLGLVLGLVLVFIGFELGWRRKVVPVLYICPSQMENNTEHTKHCLKIIRIHPQSGIH